MLLYDKWSDDDSADGIDDDWRSSWHGWGIRTDFDRPIIGLTRIIADVIMYLSEKRPRPLLQRPKLEAIERWVSPWNPQAIIHASMVLTSRPSRNSDKHIAPVNWHRQVTNPDRSTQGARMHIVLSSKTLKTHRDRDLNWQLIDIASWAAAGFTLFWEYWKARIKGVLDDSCVLREENFGADQTRRGMIVFQDDQAVMYILICLHRPAEAYMETLISQWVGTHLSLKEGVLGVLCCFGFESQLLKVEIQTPCNGMAVVTPFECYIQDDERRLKAVVSKTMMLMMFFVLSSSGER